VRNVSGHVDGAFAVGRLIGIPSAHFDPHFAQVVAAALAAFKPSLVALEMPDGVIHELMWASACWPGPVVAASSGVLFPFVPGDSMFEAFRFAVAAGIPVVLIDPPAAGSESATPRLVNLDWVGAEIVRAGAGLFLDTIDILASAGQPQARDDAREAYMARKLSQFLAQGETVVWVGGAAHWTRLVRRVKESDFDGPSVDLTRYASFRRMRLGPSSLYHVSGRLPWLVDRYAQDPAGYDEHEAIRSLCLEAGRDSNTEATNYIVLGKLDATSSVLSETETTNPIDVVRTLQYARNLAATGSLRERPSFSELLTAAAACVGPKYAGGLYELAMSERASHLSRKHDALEWEVSGGREIYRCGDDILSVRPWTPPVGEPLLHFAEIRRRAQDELYKDLPPAKDKNAETRWECAPDDEDAYVAFVEYALRRASVSDPEEAKSAPLQVGLRDGLDVRATLRDWAQGTVYVREEQRGHLNFTNGAIDWVNRSEHSDLLSGKEKGGWIDPSLIRIGSASRQSNEQPLEMLLKDPHVQRNYRLFSLVTLDAPTAEGSAKALGVRSFYQRVIRPIVNLGRSPKDHLYEWLDIMFQFCAGKPFAYYSMYVPSPEIHRVAWRYKVQVVHIPLHRLPARLLDRNRSFRFLSLTREQWEEFKRRRSARTATWSRPE